MSKLAIFKQLAGKSARSILIIKKYSPEILMGAGTISMVATVVTASRATLKVDQIKKDSSDKLERIEDFVSTNGYSEQYTELDNRKDVVTVYVQTGTAFLKLYAPAITLGVLSIACFFGAHNILKKRNLALLAAYKMAEQTFLDYRKRVVDQLGIEKDREFRYGISTESIEETITDAKGKEKTVKKDVEVYDSLGVSQYARFFDESSVNWNKTPEYNLMFLKAQQNYANDLLHANGHVFLNDIYDMIGIPRSQAGQLVGWVVGEGDNFIDFHIYDGAYEPRRDFVNGRERSILLDFNVDGVIYDLI